MKDTERGGALGARLRLGRWVGLCGVMLAALLLAGCGGGGGDGGDFEPPPPPPGGSGTGADGVPVFWTLYGYNSDSRGANLAARETSDGGFIGTGYRAGTSGVPDL